jgi:hypothetical protein
VDGDHQEQEQQQHHHHQHQQDGVAQPGSSMAHRLLPPVRIAQVRLDGPVTSGQVAALLRCFPHVQRLSLDLTLDVGQQPSPAAQHQEEQEDVADPAAGAQQQGPQPVVPRVHDAAAEAAAQLLVSWPGYKTCMLSCLVVCLASQPGIRVAHCLLVALG